MPQSSFCSVLNKLSLGQVQTILCENPTDVIDNAVTNINEMPWHRVVTQIWDTLPPQGQVITDVVETLAKVALELWPVWYQQDSSFVNSENDSAANKLLNQYSCSTLQTTQEGIALPWLKAAVQTCQKRKVPVLNDLSHQIQLAQLALAIKPDGLILAIADPQPPIHHLLGLAKAAHWVADHTNSRVILLIHEHLATVSELDAILYGAIRFTTEDLSGRQTDVTREAKYTFFPLQGRPHPFSPGEQKLAILLAQDSELAPLFKFNQRLQTIRQSQYLVDLLWAEGRVVVEVDGYRHHGNRFGFSCDRNRDYELLISDYIVLRLPHDEVMADPEIAIEKIRDVVQFRRQQRPSLREVLS